MALACVLLFFDSLLLVLFDPFAFLLRTSALLDGEHYLGALEFSPRYCLATPDRDALAVFTTPTASAFDRRCRVVWNSLGYGRHNRGVTPADRSRSSSVTPSPGCSRTTANYRAFSLTAIRGSVLWMAPVCYRRFETKSREVLQRRGLELIARPGKILYVFPLRATLDEILSDHPPQMASKL